ncbi:MAG: signal peptidase II [Chlamydiia bacterium]
MSGMTRWGIPIAALLVVFGLDVFVKELVLKHAYELPLFVATLFGKIDLWIDLVYNKGAAWGSFSEFQKPLFVLRCFVVLFVVYLFFKTPQMQKRLAFALVLAGAFGNLYDTLIHGKVIDMIHFILLGQSYGIFNLADLSIFAGIILLLFSKKASLN